MRTIVMKCGSSHFSIVSLRRLRVSICSVLFRRHKFVAGLWRRLKACPHLWRGKLRSRCLPYCTHRYAASSSIGTVVAHHKHHVARPLWTTNCNTVLWRKLRMHKSAHPSCCCARHDAVVVHPARTTIIKNHSRLQCCSQTPPLTHYGNRHAGSQLQH